MATITVRQLDDAVYEQLKDDANANSRSLEGEVRHILTERAGRGARNRRWVIELREQQREMTARFGVLPDSTDLIRQMRNDDG